ncbi:predicted protein [Phaeodactylum tricornutum CCAP 1055/1]|jgi:hypothetical protein|uniref:Uncharacterized protein n=1 Tax=Phaeodactylum tricornutum (strain CCAP 1055/1) TaxID=556484 RepID=B7G2U1_PHATC|nr:predicted protein [Phaeodactylum tricornutum CCAP 1055/1]EEC47185.1 predicted protein [Phaeodactylum tricornutum CCAP 1055/1]|eukprot:XP_002181262.1 predicted protein [Phaeodactylum tricornutum CCAP 1055/1]
MGERTIAPPLPKVVVVVGTYEGVLAGWELSKHNSFQISFATPVHGGSVRSLCIASRGSASTSGNSDKNQSLPGSLLSCGYDEYLKTHDFAKKLTSSGEVRTPSEFGTPLCSSFAPPASSSGLPSTHCLLGFAGGKLVIYKKRDWSVQHVLAGHEGGVSAMAVHPSGKMVLTGGESDGKLKLWDLTKGRLAYVSKIQPARTNIQGRTHYDAVVSLVWSPVNGDAYAFAYGSHLTVRDVATGKDLLDTELPSRVNQICLLDVSEGLFVAAACNDGSLPVLAVQSVDNTEGERRGMMAIEPVEGPVAREERFKCIHAVGGYHVVTANSAGVVSLMDLQGAINMIMSDDKNDDGVDAGNPVDPSSDTDDESVDHESDKGTSEDEETGEEELAVDMIDSIQLGTGARITCLAVYSCERDDDLSDPPSDASVDNEEVETIPRENAPEEDRENFQRVKRKWEKEVVMDPEAVERARALVTEAKKIQKRKEKKSKKHKTR